MGDLNLPPRLIEAGRKPFGHRAQIYQKMSIIQEIKEYLKGSELEFLRRCPLGGLLDIPEKPAWSGGFGLFLLSRQLDVVKEKEMWIIFAGSPIRFSLREFKIATGLLCGKYPVTKKGEKTEVFYGKLFGSEKNVTLERVMWLLKTTDEGNREIRLRYACLALVDGILLPTTHYPQSKIMEEHVEMLENLDEFLAFPWGRLSFERMMESIKERDLVQLATSDVAVQGLFIALQFVVLEAVPAILGDNSVEEDEMEEDFVQQPPKPAPFKLSHVRDLDKSTDVEVESIISPQVVFDSAEEDLTWTDEEEDDRVDNMVRLIGQGFKFNSEMFVGGQNPAELVGIPTTKVAKNVRRKKAKSTLRQPTAPRRKKNQASNITPADVDSRILEAFKLFEKKIGDIVSEKLEHNNKLVIQGMTKWLAENKLVQELGVDSVGGKISNTTSSQGNINSKEGKTATHVNLDSDNAGVTGSRASTENVQQPGGLEATVEGNSDALMGNAEVGCELGETSNLAGCNACKSGFTSQVASDRSADAPLTVVAMPQDEPSRPSLSYNPHPDEVIPGGGSVSVIEGEQTNTAAPGTGQVFDPSSGKSVLTAEEEANTANHPLTADAPVPNAVTQNEETGEIIVTGEGNTGTLSEVQETVQEPFHVHSTISGTEVADEASQTAVQPPTELRKSKRQKIASSRIDERFESGKGIKTITGQLTAKDMETELRLQKRFDAAMKSFESANGGPNSISYKEMNELLARVKTPSAKVVDALCKQTRQIFRAQKLRVEVLDSKFVAQLSREYTKFSKFTNHEDFTFSQTVVDMLKGVQLFEEVDILYLPFNYNKIHWVALAVHLYFKKIEVLECHASALTDTFIKQNIVPLAEMLPYLFRKVATNAYMKGVALTRYSIERVPGLPQIAKPVDSGTMSILFMQAHGVGGVKECKMVEPDLIPVELKKLVTSLIETFHQ